MVVFIRYFKKKKVRDTFYRVSEIKSEVDNNFIFDGDYVESLRCELTMYDGTKKVIDDVSELEIY